jgi:hypothetical protein
MTKDILMGSNGIANHDLFPELADGFVDWFHQIENYGMRSERFCNDAMIEDEFRRCTIMINWLNAAFAMGVEKGKQQ